MTNLIYASVLDPFAGIESRRLELTDARLAYLSAGMNDWEVEESIVDDEDSLVLQAETRVSRLAIPAVQSV
jgi:hypothetical protein